MSIWIILSWVFVAILTAINVVVFLKLKGASEQMLKMAFPGAKDMNEALSQMQGMMSAMGGGRPGMPNMKGGMPNLGALAGNMGGRAAGGARGPGGPGGNDAQLKAAMDMLKNMQQKGGRR